MTKEQIKLFESIIFNKMKVDLKEGLYIVTLEEKEVEYALKQIKLFEGINEEVNAYRMHPVEVNLNVGGFPTKITINQKECEGETHARFIYAEVLYQYISYVENISKLQGLCSVN